MDEAGCNGTEEVLALFAAFGSVAGAGPGGGTAVLAIAAVLTSVEGLEAGGAFMINVIGAPGPTASVGIVHATVPATFEQVQPAPDALTNTAPGGSGSVTETFGAAFGPALETLIVYVIGRPPNAVVVVVVLEIDRSEIAVMKTVAFALLLAGFASDDAELTVAVFDTPPGAPAVTLMVMGAAGPAAKVGMVHVTVPAA